VIVFDDEASFRQTPTLHATWSRRGCQPQIPTRGERNTQKIFGAVRLDNAQFTHLHQEDYFQWETCLAFVDQVLLPTFYRRGHRIYLIQDNASHHKKQETYDYFAAHRRYLEVFQLPPYWPELNAQERIRNYTRKPPPTIASSSHPRNFAALYSAPLIMSAVIPKKSKDCSPHFLGHMSNYLCADIWL
jgi:transposase